ncbi:MAG TPA: glycoside hydrolase family 99-like domain-containing protein [Phycisphaerae bacterium]|nr:glycoside hydrolase family 99-like domain-containing protein [Phycisphaerae bacterium]
MPVEVAAYYLPHWHSDPRNDAWHGKGWTEWDLVKAATPRYEGHRQPLVPAWGHADDADPRTFTREIDAAATHGVTSFLFHFYYFEDGPFLQAALDDGFLHAPNVDRIRFGLMWDNRHWMNTHPARAMDAANPMTLASGKLSPQTFEKMSRLLVDRYFTHPGYLRLENCPYFSIADLVLFVESMGGVEQAREALEGLQLKAAAAGIDGLHLNGVLWQLHDKSRWQPYGGPVELVGALGLDSVTPLSWLDHYDLAADAFPRASYAKAAAANFQFWDNASRKWPAPYVPNITIGFDPTPHCCCTDRFERHAYPFQPVLEGNTPAAVRGAFDHAKLFFSRPDAPIKFLTITAWNDWANGAYLLPDAAHGQCYLEMLKRVIGR